MPEAYKFPDELEEEKQSAPADNVEISVAGDDVEIEIVDDTPERDRGRRPLDREVEDPTDDEIESYTQGAQKRIKELTHARHDERRAKETLAREKQELERLAQHIIEENKRRGENEKKLYVMYDQMYWHLTYGSIQHYNPVTLRPEMKNYTVFAFVCFNVR